MGDVVFIAILVAFFALAVLFVRACDRIIGHELETTGPSDTADVDQAAA